MNLSNGQRVWVRIQGTPSTPEALAPGIVVDNRLATREVIRSAAKGGPFALPNSVMVISLRILPSGRTFYTERPEAAIGLFDRPELIPAVDGAPGTSIAFAVAALRIEVQKSLDSLAPAPTDELRHAAAEQYGKEPVLA